MTKYDKELISKINKSKYFTLFVAVLNSLFLFFIAYIFISAFTQKEPTSITSAESTLLKFGMILFLIIYLYIIFYLFKKYSQFKKYESYTFQELSLILNNIIVLYFILAFFSMYTVIGPIIYLFGIMIYSSTKKLLKTPSNNEGKNDLNIKENDLMQSIIPLNNPMSIKSYYLGVVGMLPIIGIPFGIASIYFSKKGLEFLKNNANTGGADHCRIGIGLSIFGFILSLLFIYLITRIYI